MSKIFSPMKVVSERTGLSPHVLRVWERRYEVVRPERSDTNRRLYAEDEVEKLELLATLTRGGHGIRQIAPLSMKELRAMVKKLPAAPHPEQTGAEKEDMTAKKRFLDASWNRVVDLDADGLREVLDEAALTLGISVSLEQVIIPLIAQIGTGWETGRISVAEEHAASAVIKEVLILGSRPFANTYNAPCLVVATPSGQLHELGAVLVSCIARRKGWRVSYLGVSLPAAEIARTARHRGALAVALSIVYPADDSRLPDEIRRLRDGLPGETAILVGGQAATGYASALKDAGASTVSDLKSFSRQLDALRARP